MPLFDAYGTSLIGEFFTSFRKMSIFFCTKTCTGFPVIGGEVFCMVAPVTFYITLLEMALAVSWREIRISFLFSSIRERGPETLIPAID